MLPGELRPLSHRPQMGSRPPGVALHDQQAGGTAACYLRGLGRAVRAVQEVSHPLRALAAGDALRLAARTAAPPGRLVGKPGCFPGRQGTRRVQAFLYRAGCSIEAAG